MHVWRPLVVILALVALVLGIRLVVVPKDFGVYGKGYVYGWHRRSNEAEWKRQKVQYRGRDYCRDCHDEQMTNLLRSPHAPIQCENCHGPAAEHPDYPEKLPIDKSRELCLRCHASLPYSGSARARIKAIEPYKHYPDTTCSDCHEPHHPVQAGG